MKLTALPAATALAAVMATNAMASSISIISLQGNWTNPSANIPVEIKNADPASSINWGNSGSGYDFTAVETPFNDPASPFRIGTFEHRNRDLGEDSQLANIDLQFVLQGAFEETIFFLPIVFPPVSPPSGRSLYLNFLHDETPNVFCPDPPAPDRANCDDLITLSLAGGSSSARVGQNQITLTLLGFSSDEGKTISTSFRSPKFDKNSADLYARIDIAIIPLPAAGWLLLGGLGSLAVLRRRKKSA